MKKFKLFNVIALIAVMLVTLLAVPVSAADEGTKVTDTISFTYDEATATLTFSGTGKMPDYKETSGATNHYNKSPWYVYADTAQNLVIGEGITHIGTHDFRYFNKLKNVTLPDSLTVIYGSAFRDIGGTSEVTVNIPAKVNVVGQFAFYSNKLKLIFAERTSVIGNLNASVFYKDATKVDVTLVYEGSNPEVINNVRAANAKIKTVVLYNPTTNTLTVGKNGEMTALTDEAATQTAWAKYADKCEKIVIEDGTTTVGGRSFKNFTKLSEVVLPEGVTQIGKEAFQNSNVKVWNLPSTLAATTNTNYHNGIYISDNNTYVIYPGSADISNYFKISADNAGVEYYTLANSAFYKEDESHHILTPGINNLGGEYVAIYNTGSEAVEGSIIDAQYTADKESLVTASVKPISAPAGVVRYTALDAKNSSTAVRGIYCFNNTDMITPLYGSVNFN